MSNRPPGVVPAAFRVSRGDGTRRAAGSFAPAKETIMPGDDSESGRKASFDPATGAVRGTGSGAGGGGNPDEDYVITNPGQSFRAEFDVGNNGALHRTWFAVSQGYYTEWVRGAWIKNAGGKQFAPTNETLVDAVRSWRSKQSSMETAFYNQRISARR